MRGVMIIFLMFSCLAAADLVSFQGKALLNGSLVTSGDITVTIYDAPTGGTEIYNEAFTNVISGGFFDVMLGNNTPLSMVYAKQYYLDLAINGNDIDWNGAERKKFESAVGNITETAIDLSNVTLSDFTNDAGYINWTLNGIYLYLSNNVLYFNETKLNDTIDNRAITSETDPIWSSEKTDYYNKSEVYNKTEIDAAGYLTSESDTFQTVTDRGSISTNNLTINGLNVDSGTLYVNSTSNSVGIGTISPESKFHVYKFTNDATITEVARFVDGDVFVGGGGYMSIGTADNNYTVQIGGIKVAPNTADIFFSPFKFGTGNIEVMRITGNKKVGIGTTNPTHILTINGTTDTHLLRITDDNVNYTTFVGTLSGGVEGASIGTASENDFRIFSNNTDRISITAEGDVGIGSMSPSQKLHVEGNLNVTGTIYGNGSGLTGIAAGEWTQNGAYIEANINTSVKVSNTGNFELQSTNPVINISGMTIQKSGNNLIISD